jgi:excisionase family DNA binding protein
MKTLDVLDSIPLTQVPAAIARLAARLLQESAPSEEDDPLLTPEQVAELLGVDKRFVYRHSDQLGAVRLSSRALRFPRSAVERFISEAA